LRSVIVAGVVILIGRHASGLLGLAKDDTGGCEGGKEILGAHHVICLWLNGLLYIENIMDWRKKGENRHR